MTIIVNGLLGPFMLTRGLEAGEVIVIDVFPDPFLATSVVTVNPFIATSIEADD